MSSSERFGFEWKKYKHILPYQEDYKAQFLNWVWPLQPNYFKGKKILDAGCGMGRNSYWCLKWGASELIAFDADKRTVEAARKSLAIFPNANVKLTDIYRLPWKNKFDFAFSVGVIHHLKNPNNRAMLRLRESLKPGGEVLIWVYSRVGFEKMLKILNPVRSNITSKLPLPLLHVLTYGISVPLFVSLRLFEPKSLYFQQIRRFKLAHLQCIVFDQLIPEVANYYTKEEAKSLLSGFDGVIVEAPPNKNGWIVRGRKPG